MPFHGFSFTCVLSNPKFKQVQQVCAYGLKTISRFTCFLHLLLLPWGGWVGRADDVRCSPHASSCYTVCLCISSSCFYIMLLLDVLYIMIRCLVFSSCYAAWSSLHQAMLLDVLYTVHHATQHVSVNHGRALEAHTDTMACATVMQTHPTGIQRLQRHVSGDFSIYRIDMNEFRWKKIFKKQEIESCEILWRRIEKG